VATKISKEDEGALVFKTFWHAREKKMRAKITKNCIKYVIYMI